ncbi:lipopolysaccharide export LptBFGC system permease protein LptF [Rhodococcus percolatus]|uniref:hypothetical protein n=1 Tax=Rhodococcus opacus TaxID=37919 RepID=UPI001AE190EF|nr:hypothetical protein [Rhodococcus opacus]MBP2208152.1 lipopolysaccharide export LptBFGC system permease protein LptF [Rhodococcus opacus]
MLGTRLVAASLGAGQVAVGLLYLGPSQLVRRQLPPDQLSLVVYVENAGPYWVLGFILSGIVLLTASARSRGFVVAHGLGVFIWSFYGLAVLLGALFSVPPTPVLTGTIAMVVASVNAGLAYGCAERGHR